MVIPRFRKDYENKSIKELVKEQQEIMEQIIAFENRYILKTEEDMLSYYPLEVKESTVDVNSIMAGMSSGTDMPDTGAFWSFILRLN